MSDDGVSRKERDRLVRESDFLDSAESLFAEMGFYETSMEDVAKRAEYATGTIYRYFESKEALYHALLLRKGKQYFGQTQAAFENAEDPLSQLRALIRGKVAFFAENWDFLRIYMTELAAKTGGSGRACRPPQELDDEFETYLANLRDVFVRGMKTGVFRKLNPDHVVAAFIGMSNECLQTSLADGVSGDVLEEVEMFVFDFVSGGIVTEKGRSL